MVELQCVVMGLLEFSLHLHNALLQTCDLLLVALGFHLLLYVGDDAPELHIPDCVSRLKAPSAFLRRPACIPTHPKVHLLRNQRVKKRLPAVPVLTSCHAPSHPFSVGMESAGCHRSCVSQQQNVLHRRRIHDVLHRLNCKNLSLHGHGSVDVPVYELRSSAPSVHWNLASQNLNDLTEDFHLVLEPFPGSPRSGELAAP